MKTVLKLVYILYSSFEIIKFELFLICNKKFKNILNFNTNIENKNENFYIKTKLFFSVSLFFMNYFNKNS